jgi:DnaJ-class molecular chaperone
MLSPGSTLMARVHTHYDNLKVARNAPSEVIRAAYKTLSQKYHPDRNPDRPDAMRIIQIINSAYEVLSDPAKRHEHDDWIARAESNVQETAGGASSVYFSSAVAENRISKRSRRRKFFSFRSARHKPVVFKKPVFKSFNLGRAVRRMLDQFSRYLFRKI